MILIFSQSLRSFFICSFIFVPPLWRYRFIDSFHPRILSKVLYSIDLILLKMSTRWNIRHCSLTMRQNVRLVVSRNVSARIKFSLNKFANQHGLAVVIRTVNESTIISRQRTARPKLILGCHETTVSVVWSWPVNKGASICCTFDETIGGSFYQRRIKYARLRRSSFTKSNNSFQRVSSEPDPNQCVNFGYEISPVSSRNE